MLARHLPPKIGSWIELDRQTLTLRLSLIEFSDLGYVALDLSETVVGNVFDVVLDAVFFECETTAGEEDVGLAGCCEV